MAKDSAKNPLKLCKTTTFRNYVKIEKGMEKYLDECKLKNQGCKWHYKKFSEYAGVQGPHRPWWGQGATPLWEKRNFHTSTA